MANLGKAAVFWLVALAPMAAQAAPSCAAYADELTAMRESAEALRTGVDYLALPEDALAARRIEQLEWVERTNAARLAQLLDGCGWPGPQVHPRAPGQAWALAQAASTDLRFQQRLLRHLEPAVARKEAPVHYLAITADRVALLEERPQLFGTQLRQVDACTWNYYPLDNREQVEIRRKEAGLPPLEDYKRGINDMIAKENCPPPLLPVGPASATAPR